MSGCHGSVAEHWRLKPEVSLVQLLAAAGLFIFLYFHNIYIQLEATLLVIYWTVAIKIGEQGSLGTTLLTVGLA